MKKDIFAMTFLLRFTCGSALLNLPPLLVFICQKMTFEPVIALASLVFWSTFPPSLLNSQWFSQPYINFSEFTVAYPSWQLMASTVIFWMVLAALVAFVSLRISTWDFAQKVEVSD